MFLWLLNGRITQHGMYKKGQKVNRNFSFSSDGLVFFSGGDLTAMIRFLFCYTDAVFEAEILRFRNSFMSAKYVPPARRYGNTTDDL